MRYFCPNYMTHPETVDKETFLALMLKHRPEYAIIWDVTGKDIEYFHKRVWIVQYVAIRGDTVYYSTSKHYARRAKVLFKLNNIVQVNTSEEWQRYFPDTEEFKPMRYWMPGLKGDPQETDREDLINILLRERPPYVVIWNASMEDVAYMTERVYVVSYFPVIGDTIYFSYGKFFAVNVQKRFGIAKLVRSKLQLAEHIIGPTPTTPLSA